MIRVSFTGLQHLPVQWHIHMFPGSEDCSNTAVGGHFNPTMCAARRVRMLHQCAIALNV